MVLLLLTLWVAAKEHCNLEAAGLLPELCAEDCGRDSGKDDGCGLVENAYYKHVVSDVKTAAPQLLLPGFAALVIVPEPEASPRLVPARHSEPQALLRTWQFVERAAPPSRAPAMMA
jgi:hypothetical protein